MDIDKILRQALSPDIEPSEQLNNKILLKAKENDNMNYKKRIIGITVAAVIACSATAMAAIHYILPQDVAQALYDKSLEKAFESDDAVYVNETQEYGGYKVTFLGTVSGKGISDYAVENNGQIEDNRTYAVTAIEKSDGTPMPDAQSDFYLKQSFFVSPLIKGLDPIKFNAFTLNGGYWETVQDGVLYRIVECDNMEIFADREVYLCVCTSMSYDITAYNFDENTGEITRNDSYEGLNALFSLPLDKTKADKAAADKVINEINSLWEVDGTEDDTMPEDSEGYISFDDGEKVEGYLIKEENGKFTATKQ
ncbi:hypothetical protein IMSAG049_00638 [Clostridiales bacterium]|nr:hypothetical protein IMSAG049_00638 [Clostridiales bacterium]